ncbi:family 3 glycoside hydrolase [Cryphonectria parasitica EP155]|uniref:Beta-glucosidase cel3A n=1 Tax=Cryphonectria parasitica (strain ATCC 38755 / EP155) TaxID=660469 RepID=A0A9P5CMF1_CRYP1|nr:family 3 glycoside hydrolase [Cryphonectria parasitica EP155]KAF3764314.1 family 3 glycoside hydrolase [Cryphonectria parasitica EP155]
MRRSALACLATAVALSQHAGAEDIITDPTYFYGQSEPVYPTPQQDGNGAWAAAITKAKALLDQMTMDEKVNLTSGVSTTTGCAGMIAAVPRLGFPGLCLANAGNGVGSTDYVSAWASGIHAAASWNKELTYNRGYYIGGEARTKGVNILLGPVIGPAGRVVEGGRNWEGFSPDPYLSGQLVYESVAGIQDAGVITSTKHFLGYEQETHRLLSTATPWAEPISSNIDDKTIHELYLWPFQDAVRAGSANIMCSYNGVNNSAACQNSKTLNGLLKGELGFQGFVVSDWDAQNAGVASALAGLDVAMPSSTVWGDNLTLAISNGTVNETRLDDMVTRILTSWYQLGQDSADFPAPGYGLAADLSVPHPVVDARNASGKPTLFAGAVEGHVLVKNTNNALPLKSAEMKLISLFGYSAKVPNVNNYQGIPTGQLFPAWSDGVESANYTEFSLKFLGDLNVTGSPTAPNGTLITGGGSGTTSQSFISAPYDALVAQAYQDGTDLYWDFENGAPLVNPTTDACIVIGNAWATEGYDRPAVRDDFTDGLINNVADQCNNTIVVFHNAGTRLVVDHPNVTAIIFAHLPGQDSGKALIDILYGRENPSGRLPYTVAANETDYGALLHPDLTLTGTFQHFPQSNFSEGVYIDYRHFDLLNITPRYEFGFGLSYTTFDYANLAVTTTNGSTAPNPTGAVAPGGQTDLWDELVRVTADVTNSGAVDGKEVAQLYLGIPGEDVPVRQLRGFEKPLIAAGETVTVEFSLTRRDLSVWDVVAQKWLLQAGEYQVYVGRSSRDLPLQTSFSIS